MSNCIRPLEASDVAQAFALSQAVGWNQTAADWRLAIEMNPAGCFAMDVDGAVMATTTSIRYGTELGWVGMVLTHPQYRGRGFADALVRRALDHLSDVETIKLDATEMGAPLYRRLGFEDECVIERWIGQGRYFEADVSEPGRGGHFAAAVVDVRVPDCDVQSTLRLLRSGYGRRPAV
jgi:GNAT superfamily N-acetyltransferase